MRHPTRGGGSAPTCIRHDAPFNDVPMTRRATPSPQPVGDEHYRGLFNKIPVGLFRTTVGGKILEANPALLDMLGYSSWEQLRAIRAEDLYVDPEVRRQWIAALERDDVVTGFESRLRRFDGSVIWVTASARLVRDPSGAASYLEGAVEDITARRQAQESIIRAREADRANQAKNEFLVRMSHELRTPLNAMLGFAQLLEMGSLSPDQRENTDQILKAGRRLDQLIGEVLDIARIDAGQMAISLGPVPLGETVRETLALIAPLAAQAKINLDVEEADAARRDIVADQEGVRQVLLNLLSNAVKYNRPGGSVVLSFEDAPRGRIRIKVRDTGPGLSREKLDRLFSPFERLGAEQTDIEGTGLGLAFSRRLVDAMGGTLGVDSVEGTGSTFWVEFVSTRAPRQ